MLSKTSTNTAQSHAKYLFIDQYTDKCTCSSRCTNGLDPDQDQHPVGPDLGSNYSDNQSPLARKELNEMLLGC